MRRFSIPAFCLLSGAHVRTGVTAVQQSLRLKKIIQHSGFSMRHSRNDIALLQLEQPVQLSSKVNLVCLPQEGTKVAPGTSCYISGNCMNDPDVFISKL